MKPPKDLFSGHAAAYAAHRPRYPRALFEVVERAVPEHLRRVAWDVGTGNGQVALELAASFGHVDATDISAAQLAAAFEHPRVTYRVCRAEHTPFEERRFDAIAVAQAYHWFDAEAFWAEVHRVARPDAVVAIWGYATLHAADATVDAAIVEFYEHTVGEYWEPERRLLEAGYATMPFPLEPLPTPALEISVSWTRAELVSYIRTWSAVKSYEKAHRCDPCLALDVALAGSWPRQERVELQFPIHMRMGRLPRE